MKKFAHHGLRILQMLMAQVGQMLKLMAITTTTGTAAITNIVLAYTERCSHSYIKMALF